MALNFHQPKFWHRKNLIAFLLYPLAFIYQIIVSIRRFYYLKLVKPKKFPVPIIVVGNITVGGTGKTPLVIWLTEMLIRAGYQPGIISRGYGGKAAKYPCLVTANSSYHEVGDEALLLQQHTNCPIVVGPNRVAAAKKLLATTRCNLIISDDGLQHYALHRDISILVVDAKNLYGNRFCLPAGPLREPLRAVQGVDFIIKNFNSPHPNPLPLQKTQRERETTYATALQKTQWEREITKEYAMFLIPDKIINLKNSKIEKTFADFKFSPVHAVAGIGNPQKFFTTLREFGLTIIEHPFPDHYEFQTTDLPFHDQPIIMTEKDAVKCREIATANFWYLRVKANLTMGLQQSILAKCRSLIF